MSYLSTKVYGHEVGLSCCFRQHKAQGHCKLLHGYALGVKFIFAADELDECGWVVDFGGLKPLKAILQETFDHTLLVAEDDPMRDVLWQLCGLGVANVIIVERTGCEAFAKLIYDWTEQWLIDAGFSPRCGLVSVEVKEHAGNSAIYLGDKA